MKNIGGGPTSGAVTVTDTLPASLTATAIAGNSWSCTLATLTCTRSDALQVNQVFPPIIVTVNVASNAPASVTNNATVSGGGELNATNDSASDVTVVNGPPDLILTKTHTGNFFQNQTGAQYTLTVKNIGGGPTSGAVTVTDTLPASLTATGIAGSSWACTLATLSCTRSDALQVNQVFPPIIVTVNVASNAPASVTNNAAVSGGGELDATNDSASDVTAVNGAPDLILTKTHTGNFFQNQTGAQYTLTVKNIGGGVTSGAVTVTDTLPASLTATGIAGSSWACTLATLSCTRSDALQVNQVFPPIIVTVNVASNAPASVTNNATVSGGGELNATNDSASDVTVVNGPPDLILTKTHTGNFFQNQTGAQYTLTVKNIGGGVTSGAVTVTDTLPASLTATGIAGSSWACTLATLSCTRSDALQVNQVFPPIIVTVNVASNAPASVTNNAAVSGGGELDATNDSASDVTAVNGAPDLILTKTHTGNFFQNQTGAQYTLTVKNIGGGVTSGAVTVTDTLPASLTATGIAGNSWACTLATLSCTRSDALQVNQVFTPIIVTVNVAPDAPTSLTNTAQVSGGGELNLANNGASDLTTVNSSPDLTLTKSHSGNFVQNQTGAQYNLVVKNVGGGSTSGAVTVIDTLQAGLTSTAIVGTGWTCTLGTLSCTRSDALGAGASYARSRSR